MTQSTEALQGARTEVTDLRRQIQTLEIELESQKSLVSTQPAITTEDPSSLSFSSDKSSSLFYLSLWQKASLEGTLRDTEMRYNMEMESLNDIIRGLEAELMQLRNNIQQQTHEYEALLNIKMKLEAEIATYKRLLDGGDIK